MAVNMYLDGDDSKCLSTPKEIEQFCDEQLKKEIKELFAGAGCDIFEFFKNSNDEDSNDFFVRSFSCVLSVSSYLKKIKDKCNQKIDFDR